MQCNSQRVQVVVEARIVHESFADSLRFFVERFQDGVPLAVGGCQVRPFDFASQLRFFQPRILVHQERFFDLVAGEG